MCTSYCVTKNLTYNSQNLIGRNCDRHVGSAPNLVYVPAKNYEPGEKVTCSFIEIPQVCHTYAFIASKIWDSFAMEHGVNECGVAVTVNVMHSVAPKEEHAGLVTGDLVHLALERSATAREAVQIVGKLIERYGQESREWVYGDSSRWETGFFFSDEKEIWRMETAGCMWVATKVENRAWAMTNCYGIATEIDMEAQGLREFAYQNKYANPKEEFNFAKVMNEPGLNYFGNLVRARRMQQLLDEEKKPVNLKRAMQMLRDHHEDNPSLKPCYGVGNAVVPSVCMHSHVTKDAKTDSSVIYTYNEILGTISWVSFSTPCTSIFMPIYFTGYIPERMNNATGSFDESSLWWSMEWLSTVAEMNHELFMPRIRKTLDPLEESFIEEATEIEKKAKEQILNGENNDAYYMLNDFMDRCAEKIHEVSKVLAHEFYEEVQQQGGAFGARNQSMIPVWNRCGLPIKTKSRKDSLEQCLNENKVIIIGCQGDEKSNNYRAVRELALEAGIKNYEIRSLISSENVIKELQERKIDFGVMAVSTVASGEIIETKKACKNVPVEALNFISINIHHCIFTKNKSIQEDNIKKVISHQENLKECINHIWEMFPDALLVPIADTVFLEKQFVKDELADDTAVLCSKEMGEAHNLFLLKENVEDQFINETKFALFCLRER